MHFNPTNSDHSLQRIFDAGGHFILAKEDKRPLWRSWDKLRPPIDLVKAHDGPLGLKPWSVGTTGLDVDLGDPSLLLEDHPAMAVLLSKRPGGKHLYYHDTKGRGNGSFSVLGCSGEIRSDRGYLILWGDGAAVLADALSDPIARSRTLPADLFEAAGVGGCDATSGRQGSDLSAESRIKGNVAGGRSSCGPGAGATGGPKSAAVRCHPVLVLWDQQRLGRSRMDAAGEGSCAGG